MSPSADEFGREFDERPWGTYLVLDDTAQDHKVKRIVVAPGKRLSYQYHHKRAEHWYILSGSGRVCLDGVDRDISAGDTIEVGTEVKHRIENTGTMPLTFIEVQHGTYFGEDDIVRLDDDFGRS